MKSYSSLWDLFIEERPERLLGARQHELIIDRVFRQSLRIYEFLEYYRYQTDFARSLAS